MVRGTSFATPKYAYWDTDFKGVIEKQQIQKGTLDPPLFIYLRNSDRKTCLKEGSIVTLSS